MLRCLDVQTHEEKKKKTYLQPIFVLLQCLKFLPLLEGNRAGTLPAVYHSEFEEKVPLLHPSSDLIVHKLVVNRRLMFCVAFTISTCHMLGMMILIGQK